MTSAAASVAAALLLLIGVSVIGVLSYVAALYSVLIARKQLI